MNQSDAATLRAQPMPGFKDTGGLPYQRGQSLGGLDLVRLVAHGQ